MLTVMAGKAAAQEASQKYDQPDKKPNIHAILN